MRRYQIEIIGRDLKQNLDLHSVAERRYPRRDRPGPTPPPANLRAVIQNDYPTAPRIPLPCPHSEPLDPQCTRSVL
jgi:hypothetical protein